MEIPLKISLIEIRPENGVGRVVDLGGRCAFAICSEGDMVIKILNEEYHVTDNCIFACMPFVTIEVMSINKHSKFILGGIRLEDVLSVINKTVNSSNLIAINQTPLVHIGNDQLKYLTTSIMGYIDEMKEITSGSNDNFCNQINNEIIECHSRLIIAQIMKMYFANISMDVKGHTHTDIIFQHFMLDLYAHCRQERNVHFYAMRSGMSLKYFSTIIKKMSGKKPSEWIERVLVGEAKRLLQDNQKSIKGVATELNFPDAPTFSKYFRRLTGQTPKQYRTSETGG